MNSDFSEAKTGDWAWTIRSGWRRIEDTTGGIRYPISIGGCNYTITGKFFKRDVVPSAFIIPPKELCSDPPPCEFKRGDKVLVWDMQTTKHRRYFSHIEAGFFYCFANGTTEWSDNGGTELYGWKHCVHWT